MLFIILFDAAALALIAVSIFTVVNIIIIANQTSSCKEMSI